MLCPRCSGTGIGLGGQGNCSVCGGRGQLPEDRTLTEKCNRCAGTGIGTDPNGNCTICHGYGRVAPISSASKPDSPLVFLVESGKPRTAHLQLADLFSKINGELRICDPYYGVGSLLRLDLLRHCSPIMFLTKNPDRSESHILSRALSEWKRQHGAIEFRENVTKDLHDRFLLTDDELILMGHGLKDVGNKDSFVIMIPNSMAPDTVASVKNQFDKKWAAAKVIS